MAQRRGSVPEASSARHDKDSGAGLCASSDVELDGREIEGATPERIAGAVLDWFLFKRRSNRAPSRKREFARRSTRIFTDLWHLFDATYSSILRNSSRTVRPRFRFGV